MMFLGVRRATKEFCAMLREILDENLRLKAENESLRIENDKLRELVRKIEHYEQEGCYKCAYSESCYAQTLYDGSCAMSVEIGREKRELGIESEV